MFSNQKAAERLEERRNARARIARLRRRIDRRAGLLVDRSCQLIAWRGYVARYPAQSLLAATGLGFVLATVIDKVRLPAGMKLHDLATGAAWAGMWRNLRKTRVTDPVTDAPESTDE